MSFFEDLQPASFRGVAFGVLTEEGRFGRRVSVHEYPFRDKPWVEDLGRGTRRFSFVAFLIEDPLTYEGDPSVLAQREAMIAACETLGPGTLVHPTLGELTVNCPEDGCVITNRWDEGRYFEIGFTFIENGERQFPDQSSDTETDSDDAADDTDEAAGDDYSDDWDGVDDSGQAVIGQVTETSGEFSATLLGAALSATSLFSLLVTLPGNFGRYFPGGLIGYLGRVQPPAGVALSIEGLIAEGAASRAVVAAAIAAFELASMGTDPGLLASTVQEAVAALLAATPDPGALIPLLMALANFYPDAPTTDSIIGMAMAAIQDAAGALFRRAILAALARACALYQPTSRDDAASLRDQVCVLIDIEINTSGETGDDSSYLALQNLRRAVVNDLNTRGAGLPPIQVFTFASNLPALTIAQSLYQDYTRSDELIAEGNPPHPAFMPLSFSALAS